MEPVAPPRGLRLLSLDGGGVRGLSSLLILKRIMFVLDRKVDSSIKRPLLPCDYFDMVTGTSTGGLIAIMFGVLKMDIDTCISHYQTMAPQIFPEEGFITGSKFGKLWKGTRGAACFDAEKLEHIIKGLVADTFKNLGEDAVLENMSNVEDGSYCRTFVCTVNKDVNKSCLLRSYQSSWEPGTGCSIWQAARATSAAPLYFPPIRFGNPPAKYVDGGLRYNNPVRALCDEAKRVWKKPKHRIGRIISIGTGIKQLKDVGNRGTEILWSLTDIALDSQQTDQEFADEMEHRIEERDESLTYVRLDVDQGLQNMGLEEWKSFELLTGATNECLKNHKGDIERCATALLDLNDRSDNRNEGFTILSELPISSPRFFGRISELKEIHETIHTSNLEQKRVVLWGLGGSGKSHLALQYIERNQNSHSAILWINATSHESADESLSQVVSGIKALEHFHYKALLPKAREKDMNFVQRWLVSASNRNWLMVIDSVDDLESFNCKRIIPQCKHGNVIITTTQSHLAKSLDFHGIEVASIGLDAGSDMLLSDTNPSVISNIDTAKRIVKELDGIPLAIEQARALIQDYIPIHEFLDYYNKEYSSIMASKPDKSSWFYDKDRSMLIVLYMMFNRLNNCNQDSANLLALISCFGPRITHLKMLEQIQGQDEVMLEPTNLPGFSAKFQWLVSLGKGKLSLRRAINQLEKFLVLKTRKDSTGAITSFSVHGTICRWRLETLSFPERDDWIMLAAFILAQHLPDLEDNMASQIRHLAPVKYNWHLIQRYIAPKAVEPPDGRLSRPYGSVMSQYGSLYLHCGGAVEAEGMLLAAVLYNKLNQGSSWPKDRKSLLLMKNLAMALWKYGKLALAAETIKSIYESSATLIGLDDELTTWAATQLRKVRERSLELSNIEQRTAVASAGPKRNLTYPLDGNPVGNSERVFKDESFYEMSDEEYTLSQRAELCAEEFGVDNEETHSAINALASYYKRKGKAPRTQKAQVWINQVINRTPLHEAVSSLVKRLLNDRANVSAKDREANNSLYLFFAQLATEHKWFTEHDAVRLAVTLCRDFYLSPHSLYQYTRLLSVAIRSNPEVVEILLERGAGLFIRDTTGKTLLHKAVEHGFSKLVEFLLERGAEINALDFNGEIPFHNAIRLGNYRLITRLIEKGADIIEQDIPGWTPLHRAARDGNQKIIDHLLEKGADVNKQDTSGWTPLHRAAKDGNQKVIDHLFEKEADVNKQTILGQTPLHWAVRIGKQNVIDQLLEKGADVNKQDTSGWTPLHCAARAGNRKVVDQLLEKGADINALDIWNQTPLQRAKVNEDDVMVEFLIKRGAVCHPSLDSSSNLQF